MKSRAERPGFDLTRQRRAGVLAHLTSLPGPHGHGDLGPAAFVFADFLAASGQSVWQTLPVSPPGWGASPYDTSSTFAGSPWLISLVQLERDGLLTKRETAPPKSFRTGRAQLLESQQFREERLRRAHARFLRHRPPKGLQHFRQTQSAWLPDHCLFSALHAGNPGKHWMQWRRGLRSRQPEPVAAAQQELRSEIAFHEWVQFVFDSQWQALAKYCREKGIALLGDVPMFVAHDGADVWANQSLFRLNADGSRRVVAGVPPDLFSATGQLWGNPVYDWKAMQAAKFAWWVARFQRCLELFDVVRLDHFIGFSRCWEIPAAAKDARGGRFVPVPGEALFARVRKALGDLPFLAEDLGIVTPQVVALRESLGLPGMRVLQFAFGDPEGSEYLPHRFSRDTVVYTGTHDNDTSLGWYRSLGRGGRAGLDERRRLHAYLGASREPPHWQLIRLAYSSIAAVAVVPLQDCLGLGSRARMNVPGTSENNWAWRVSPRDLNRRLAVRLRKLATTYERAP